VSHHGSKYSSNLFFLEKVAPKISVVEVGKNSYGHPAKEALDRLKKVGSQIFNTYEQGIIKIVKEGGELKVFNL
jgi:competence protein ComEC